MPSSCNQGHLHDSLQAAIECNKTYRPLIDAIAKEQKMTERPPVQTPYRVQSPKFRPGDRVAWIGDNPLGHPACPVGTLVSINERVAQVKWDQPHEAADRFVSDPYHDGYFVKARRT